MQKQPDVAAAKRTHWRVERYPSDSWKTACGADIYLDKLCYAEYLKELVDCRVCMYHLGLYIPLSKLREHQLKNGMPDWYTAAAMPFIPYELTEAGFCRACGASIPHRVGEGRCSECMHHLPQRGNVPAPDRGIDHE